MKNYSRNDGTVCMMTLILALSMASCWPLVFGQNSLIAITLSGRNLPDVNGPPNPFLNLTLEATNGTSLIGETEVQIATNNPNWTIPLDVPFVRSLLQNITFDLWYAPSNSSTFQGTRTDTDTNMKMGSVSVSLIDLLLSPIIPLEKSFGGAAVPGKLLINVKLL